jgi:hypothetical protein
MAQMGDDLRESRRDIQTEMRKAFYSFAESNQLRLASIETESEGMKKRLGILEERVFRLEQKSNQPPLSLLD